MAYIINDTRGQIVAVIEDGTIDTTSTDLQLVGRGVTDYGTAENENLVWLMENFANDTPPLTPLVGQIWYSTGDGGLYVRSSGNTWQGFATETYVDAQKISPAFTGVPTAPTASSTNSSTQLATTAFVQAQKVSPSFTGVPTAPTAPSGNSTTQIATTAFVQAAIGDIDLTQYAPINNPGFTGTPTAPTPTNIDDTNRVATTAFVQAQKVSPVFSGIPRASTAALGTVTTQLATTAFVSAAVGNVNLSIYAPKASPTFTGTPLAPTAAVGTATTQLATTAFVSAAVGNVNLSIYAPKASPQFTGTPGAPTASPGTNTTQLATTEFVQSQVARGSYSLPTASTSILGGVKVDGTTITATGGGVISAVLNLPTATASTLGGVKVGSGLTISSGVLSVTSGPSYVLPKATTSVLGGVIADGTTITVNGSGVITATATNYTLPIASSSVLGGFKVGSGLSISGGGILSVPTATTSILGGVKVDGTTITINGSGQISATGGGGGGGGDATLGTVQTFTAQKYFAGGIVAGTSSAPTKSSYNFYDSSGSTTATSINYNWTAHTINVSLEGNLMSEISPTYVQFFRQVKVPSTGIRFNDGTTQTTASSGGTATNPAGSNTQVQFNNAGSFGATSNLTYDSATKLLQINGARYGTVTDGPSVVAYVIGDQYAGIGIQTPREVGVVLENNALRPTQLNVDSGNQAWNWRNLYVKDNFVWNGKTITAPGTSTTLFLRNDGTWATPAGGGAAYTLPTASTSTLGGVKVDGTTVTINGSGVITANMQTAQGFYITKGTTQTYGFTNSFQFDNSANYFDVFPPAGYTMSQYAGGIVSIAYIYFAGDVDQNDALRCIADPMADRFRVYVQNTEQRAAPSANWIAFWTNV